MRLQTDRYGYKYVMLSKDGNEKHEKVHRLVGFAFCDGYSEERHCINHKDENPSNNHCDNLEWVTYSENINHGTRNKRVAHKVSYAKRRTVQQISPDGDIVAEYRNGAEAARQTGVCHTRIIGCCKGRANTAGGYLWRYAD